MFKQRRRDCCWRVSCCSQWFQSSCCFQSSSQPSLSKSSPLRRCQRTPSWPTAGPPHRDSLSSSRSLWRGRWRRKRCRSPWPAPPPARWSCWPRGSPRTWTADSPPWWRTSVPVWWRQSRSPWRGSRALCRTWWRSPWSGDRRRAPWGHDRLLSVRPLRRNSELGPGSCQWRSPAPRTSLAVFPPPGSRKRWRPGCEWPPAGVAPICWLCCWCHPARWSGGGRAWPAQPPPLRTDFPPRGCRTAVRMESQSLPWSPCPPDSPACRILTLR